MIKLNNVLKSALEYAGMGWYVVPVYRAGRKIPYTKHGLLDGSIDESIINSWWEQWPDANVAIVAYMSKLVVFDADTSEAVDVISSILKNHNINTLTSITSRGAHYIFQFPFPDNIRIRGKLDYMPGVDIKYRGYFVAPPSIHSSGEVYSWADDNFIAPAELPKFLLDDIVVELNTKYKQDSEIILTDASTHYGLAALNSEVDNIANALQGERNNKLFLSALNIGRLIGGGQLEEHEAFNALRDAGLASGMSSNEVDNTIKSGFKSGLRSPRTPQDSVSVTSDIVVDEVGSYLEDYPPTIWEHYFSTLSFIEGSDFILYDNGNKIAPYYHKSKPIGFVSISGSNELSYSSSILYKIIGISGALNNNTVYICTDIFDMLTLESLGYSPICIFGNKLIPQHLYGLSFDEIILVPKADMELGASYAVAKMFARDVKVISMGTSGYESLSVINDKAIVNNLLHKTRTLKDALGQKSMVGLKKSFLL